MWDYVLSGTGACPGVLNLEGNIATVTATAEGVSIFGVVRVLMHVRDFCATRCGIYESIDLEVFHLEPTLFFIRNMF